MITGLTTIVNVCVFPGQALIKGVTVIVAVIGVAPVFVAVNDAIFPVPLAAKPIDVLLFVQEYPVGNVPVKFIAGITSV